MPSITCDGCLLAQGNSLVRFRGEKLLRGSGQFPALLPPRKNPYRWRIKFPH
jgi:hypothetical protein